MKQWEKEVRKRSLEAKLRARGTRAKEVSGFGPKYASSRKRVMQGWIGRIERAASGSNAQTEVQRVLNQIFGDLSAWERAGHIDSSELMPWYALGNAARYGIDDTFRNRLIKLKRQV